MVRTWRLLIPLLILPTLFPCQPVLGENFNYWMRQAKLTTSLDERIAHYSSAIDSWSEEDGTMMKAEAFLGRAWSHYEKKDWHRVVTDATTAVEIDPSNWLGYHYRAWAHYFRGNFAEADADHLRTIEWKPDDPYLYFSAALSQNLDGRPYDAAATLDRGLAVDSGFVMLYTERGFTALELNDNFGAMSWFQAARDRDFEEEPIDLGPLLGMALAKWRVGLYGDALDYYDELLWYVDTPDKLDIWMNAYRGFTPGQNRSIDEIDDALLMEYEGW